MVRYHLEKTPKEYCSVLQNTMPRPIGLNIRLQFLQGSAKICLFWDFWTSISVANFENIKNRKFDSLYCNVHCTQYNRIQEKINSF